MRHTPGPWFATTENTLPSKGAIEIQSEYGSIAHVYGGECPDDETQPNARLIAAAPEMAVELRERVADCMCQHDSIRHPDGCNQCENGRTLLARIDGP